MSEFEKQFWRMIISQLDLEELVDFAKKYDDDNDYENIADHEKEMLDLIKEYTGG